MVGKRLIRNIHTGCKITRDIRSSPTILVEISIIDGSIGVLLIIIQDQRNLIIPIDKHIIQFFGFSAGNTVHAGHASINKRRSVKHHMRMIPAFGRIIGILYNKTISRTNYRWITKIGFGVGTIHKRIGIKSMKVHIGVKIKETNIHRHVKVTLRSLTNPDHRQSDFRLFFFRRAVTRDTGRKNLTAKTWLIRV